MLKYSKITKNGIKNFAGDVIFNRGYSYYNDGLVEDFEYDQKKQIFSASIQGSVGCYSIEVWNCGDNLEANCDCPFDGYPYKHIVAVLLYFLNNKDEYLKDLKVQQKKSSVVKDKLSELSKAELIRLILSFSKKYPSIRRELNLKLSDDKQLIMKQFFKEIDKIFRTFESHNFSTYEISTKLKEIIKHIETADDFLKVEIIWKIADGVLHQLNTYGMDDLPLENIAIETMDTLVELLNNVPRLDKRRKEIQGKLEKYGEQGNCGIVDDICEAAFEISDENN